MYCPKCGTQAQDDQRFCINCSTELTGADIAQAQLQTEEPAAIEYAGFWRRLVAYILDNFIIGAVFVIISLFLPDDRTLFTTDIFGRWPVDFTVYETIENLLVSWFYFSIMESSPTRGTLGKMIMEIAVTDMYGERISFGRATGRHFAKIISGIILLIGYIMIAFTKKKQGLHDMMADTLVITKD